VEKKVA
jgi:histone H1/5